MALVAVALVAGALTGCGVGKADETEQVSETASSYLKALAAGNAAQACAQLTPHSHAVGCASAVTDRLARLDSRALSRAADPPMGINVHGNAATASLPPPTSTAAGRRIVAAGGTV